MKCGKIGGGEMKTQNKKSDGKNEHKSIEQQKQPPIIGREA